MITNNIHIEASTKDLLFRIGLSSFFLIGSLTALFSPSEFLELLGMNTLATSIATPQFWVYIISINDGLLFLLILLGSWRKGVAIWAGLWIIAVTYVTTSEGTFGIIEHIGVLSFISYYYFTYTKTTLK